MKRSWLRRAARAYTVVELMSAIAVFGIGITGVIALQKVVLTSNTRARQVAIASQIANSWAAQLEADATLWTVDNGLANTRWLNLAPINPGVWFQPNWNPQLQFGPAFGPLGQPMDFNADPNIAAPFCVHLRLQQVYAASPSNGVIRADIKVFWNRKHGGNVSASPCNNVIANTADPLRFHFVMQSTAVRQMP